MPAKQPALFLDRDGIIIHDKHYLFKKEEVEFFPEIFPIIKEAKKRNFLVICLTNQSGISRGYFSENDFKEVSHYIQEELRRHQTPLDHLYMCPSTEKENNPWRKPAPGMVEQALKDHPFIEIKKSTSMVGV